MKIETFFEKFERFADAPDAVAKMRALILRLAMQGKLSEPHDRDVPVIALLRIIEEEKECLGIKSSSKSFGENSEIAEGIPARWTWVRFGEIARHNAGKTLDKGRNSGELRDYITTSNLYWGFFQIEEVRQMPIRDEELERCTAVKGDLLICEGGEAGRSAVWPHDYEISFQNHVHRARFYGELNPYFVQRYFEKLNATGEINKYRKGVGISNMSGKSLASIPIPLPPLAEQKRIVAKVDELMGLCDRLALQQEERETRRAALARATMARFADAPTPANLNLLFHNSYTIAPADLRKSILTLAVQGKLVPQDPNDAKPEPVLLDIQRSRVRLRNAGKLRAAKVPDKAFLEESLPFIPDSWRTVSFDHLAVAHNNALKAGPFGSALKKEFYAAKGYKIYGQEQVIAGDPFIGDYYIDETKFGELESCAVSTGDILISLVGTIGKLLVLPEGIEPGIINPRVIKLSLDPSLVYPMFIKILIGSPYAVDFFEENSHGGTMNILNLSILRAIPLPLPPLAEQRRIVAKVDALMALVDALETQLATARTADTALLEAAVAELT